MATSPELAQVCAALVEGHPVRSRLRGAKGRVLRTWGDALTVKSRRGDPVEVSLSANTRLEWRGERLFVLED